MSKKLKIDDKIVVKAINSAYDELENIAATLYKALSSSGFEPEFEGILYKKYANLSLNTLIKLCKFYNLVADEKFSLAYRFYMDKMEEQVNLVPENITNLMDIIYHKKND